MAENSDQMQQQCWWGQTGSKQGSPQGGHSSVQRAGAAPSSPPLTLSHESSCFLFTHTHTHTNRKPHTHTPHKITHTQSHTHTNTKPHIHTNTHVLTYTKPHTHTHTHTQNHTHTHKPRTQTHTQTYTQTHIHTNPLRMQRQQERNKQVGASSGACLEKEECLGTRWAAPKKQCMTRLPSLQSWLPSLSTWLWIPGLYFTDPRCAAASPTAGTMVCTC